MLMRQVPECQNNKNRCSWMILYQSVWVHHRGVPLPPRVPPPVTTTDFVQCFLGRDSGHSSPHPPPPLFFLVLTFSFGQRTSLFLLDSPQTSSQEDVLTFIRLWHLQFHWRNELPKMLKSKVPNLSLSHSSLPISILPLSSLALP